MFKIAEGVSSVQTCSTSEEKASRYEMTFGLMILSKKELSNTSVEGFNNRSQFRGFLQATVSDMINRSYFVVLGKVSLSLII